MYNENVIHFFEPIVVSAREKRVRNYSKLIIKCILPLYFIDIKLIHLFE